MQYLHLHLYVHMFSYFPSKMFTTQYQLKTKQNKTKQTNKQKKNNYFSFWGVYRRKLMFHMQMYVRATNLGLR